MPVIATCSCTMARFLLSVRILSAVGHLLTIAAGAYGFVLADRMFKADVHFTEYVSGKSLTFYTGMMALYFTLFGLIGFLGELNSPKLKKTVLKPFGFLNSFLGRGAFMIYVGSILLLIPWDVDNNFINITPASILIAMGAFQLTISLCVRTETSMNTKVGERVNLSPPARIAWGQPESLNTPAKKSPSSDETTVEVEMISESDVVVEPNPIYKPNSSSSSPAQEVTNVITKNPFLQ